MKIMKEITEKILLISSETSESTVANEFFSNYCSVQNMS